MKIRKNRKTEETVHTSQMQGTMEITETTQIEGTVATAETAGETQAPKAKKAKAVTAVKASAKAVKTSARAVKTFFKTVGKAIARLFVWLGHKFGQLFSATRRSRSTHPTAWKRGVAAVFVALFAANITVSSILIVYSVRARRESEWAASYAVDLADSAKETVDAYRSEAKSSAAALESSMDTWKTNESIYSGTIGYNLTWTIDPESATLTIAGTGRMDGEFGENCRPSFTMLYRDYVRTVQIEAGVTSIAPYAFQDFKALETVSLGGDVTAIGAYAFAGCGSLEDVQMKQTQIAKIGTNAFTDCSSLKYLELPQSYATYHRITGNNGIRLFVDDANPYFTSDRNGCLYGEQGKVLLYCPVGCTTSYEETPSFEVPDGVEMLYDGCFSGCALNTLTIPGSVKNVGIGDAHFRWVSRLTLLEGVENLYYTEDKSDEDEYSPYGYDNVHVNCVQVPHSLRKIEEKVCAVTDEMELAEDCYAFEKDEDGAVYTSNGKTLLLVPETGNRTSYTVRKGVERIGEGATHQLYLCDATLTLPDSLRSIGSGNFNSITLKSGKTLTLPKNLETIGDNCFRDLTASKVYIPASIKKIGQNVLLCANDGRYYEEIDRYVNGKTTVVFGGSQSRFESICASSSMGDNVVMQYEK